MHFVCETGIKWDLQALRNPIMKDMTSYPKAET